MRLGENKSGSVMHCIPVFLQATGRPLVTLPLNGGPIIFISVNPQACSMPQNLVKPLLWRFGDGGDTKGERRARAGSANIQGRKRLSCAANVVQARLDEIANAEFALDRQVEHSKIAP